VLGGLRTKSERGGVGSANGKGIPNVVWGDGGEGDGVLNLMI